MFFVPQPNPLKSCRDRSWQKAKIMMQKIDQFLESLVHYDKENIHPNIITALEPYLKDKEFDPDFIRSTSRVDY